LIDWKDRSFKTGRPAMICVKTDRAAPARLRLPGDRMSIGDHPVKFLDYLIHLL